MNPILSEIREIRDKALEALNLPLFKLPTGVPYLGMGSSYFAPLAFKYMALVGQSADGGHVDIHPEIASEYFHYQSVGKPKEPLAVILSQSGRSSEALWCTELFEQYIAITNYPENALGTRPNVQETVVIGAGEEKFSSSKTYVNTLLALFRGLGFDPTQSVNLLVEQFEAYEQQGQQLAETVFALRQSRLREGRPVHGMYITGSGPNIATAYEAALILSESTKLAFLGLPMAQYDHGPKETAKDSLVINILAHGANYDRTQKLAETVEQADATVLTVEVPETQESFSVLHTIIPFNFMAYYLAEKLDVGDTFTVGGKVTEVV